MRAHPCELTLACACCSGGFLKRDARQKDNEVLVARLVDRPLRPMFPQGWANDTQVLTWVMSYDGVCGTEPLAITAASAALVISGEKFDTQQSGPNPTSFRIDSNTHAPIFSRQSF